MTETMKTGVPTADASAQARAIATAFAKEAHMDDGQANKLQKMIADAVGERLTEASDLRIGRVLGAALATL